MSRRRRPRSAVDLTQPVIEHTPAPPTVNDHIARLELSIAAALDAANASGVPRGFVVAVLHAHALKQTQLLIV